MGMGILALVVDVEAVVSVLDGGDPDPSLDQPRDQPGQQRGLSRPAPAGDADDAHAVNIASMRRHSGAPRGSRASRHPEVRGAKRRASKAGRPTACAVALPTRPTAPLL